MQKNGQLNFWMDMMGRIRAMRQKSNDIFQRYHELKNNQFKQIILDNLEYEEKDDKNDADFSEQKRITNRKNNFFI